MVYGYIRVSTDRQTVDNQRFEIEPKDCTKISRTVEFCLFSYYIFLKMPWRDA